MFNAIEVKNQCVEWIREWFEQNGKGCNAVIGISGGKDSSVVAALCVEALGKDRVIGVLMPNGKQSDIFDANFLCYWLDIDNYIVNIKKAIKAIKSAIPVSLSNQAEVNLPARVRMTTLYAVSQSVNGRVANTCNLSEDWIGYSTRWGDSVGDFSPLANLTTDEVVAVGEALGLPYPLTHKTPADGLCGKTDEDNFGFTYEVLNRYIRTGVCENPETKAKIDSLHEKNLFKLQPIPSFHPTEKGGSDK